MSSINYPIKDETSSRNREGQSYQPNTTGERVATHIPGTEAHAERNELQGRTSPGARVMANVPGTAEHERKREVQRETGTGLTNPAYDTRDPFSGTGRGDVGHTQPGANFGFDNEARPHGASAADPLDTMDRSPGNLPSTGAAQGAAPFRNEHGTGTEKRVGVSDKVLGATEKTLGKVLNKPAMVEKGVERQTIGKDQGNISTSGQSGL